MDSREEKDAEASEDHSASGTPSRFIRINFAAFQILLVKFLLAVTRSRERFRSWPGVVPV